MENSFTVLFIVMLIILLLTFIVSGNDILNPVCIVTGVMTLSVFLATMTIDRWHLYMSAEASIIIITSILIFDLSGFWTDWRIKRNLKSSIVTKKNNEFTITTKNILLLSLFMFILGLFQYREFYLAAKSLGNQAGILNFSAMIKTIRPFIENETFRFSRWNSYRLIVAQAGLFCSIFCFFMNIFKNKDNGLKQNLKYLIPSITFIPFILANTGREVPLIVMLYSLLTGSIIYEIRNSFSIKSKIRVLIFFSLCGAFFFIIFLLLGTLSGKVSANGRPIFEILAHYGGLSMPAFSVFLDSTPIETPYIGNTTLSDLYTKLSVLGFNVPQVKGFLPFVEFNDISTNVYTMMARYIKDYGIFGMHIIMMIIAMIYVSFYDYVRFISRKFITVAFYGLLPMTLFFSMNDDRFFSTILSTTTFYNFIVFYFMYKILVDVREEKECG